MAPWWLGYDAAMLLAEGLSVPEGTSALLLDMDGVLFDTLTMDFNVVDKLLRRHGWQGSVPREVIRRNFPHPLPEFWTRITEAVGLHLDEAQLNDLVAGHEQERRTADPVVHRGVPELLDAARVAGLRIAVVSNNPQVDVKHMLDAGGLMDRMDEVVGNDEPGLASKPAPDLYLAAAERVGVAPGDCVAVEDSVIGLAAARAAGCYAVGVATGADSFESLARSGYADRCQLDLGPARVSLGRLGITHKFLHTPNDFVSHMVEHIAWRLGCSIELRWNNDDWRALGRALAREVIQFRRLRDSAAALGMIDDGSAEVVLTVDPQGGGAVFAASAQVDLEWFLSVRCEQLANGAPLVDLLDAFGKEAHLDIRVALGSFEDPHHTWEGVYRAVGIALDRMYNPPFAEPVLGPVEAAHGAELSEPELRLVERGWHTEAVSVAGARLRRETAESVVSVDVSFAEPGAQVEIDVADSVHVSGLAQLLEGFATAAGLRVAVRFEATRLSSSHVVTEDVGMVLGRALRAIAIERMSELGIYGAGSNVRASTDAAGPVRVGVSMEGRKFWKYVPFQGDYESFRRSFLIGHTLCGDVFSEDLDDFIDGFAGGMQASVMVHVNEEIGAVAGWPLVFAGLGRATGELLSANPYRKALAPGVKATLA